MLPLWRLKPDLAAIKSYHQYDLLLAIPDEAQRHRAAKFAQTNLATLAPFDLARLSPGNQRDLRPLHDELRARRWYAACRRWMLTLPSSIMTAAWA